MRSLALVALCLSLALGCAVSRDELGRLETEVAARNAERQRTAGAELLGEGYLDAEAERRWARLDEEDRQRCLSRELGEAPMRITLDERELTADPAATCDFFRGRVARLEAAGPVVLHAIPDVGVMRAPGGELVLVRTALRTVRTHEVLVDMECDHMPRVDPDPLELGAQVPVLVAPERPREITHEVEREVVEVDCTRNTY